jgi:hypothetical protein
MDRYKEECKACWCKKAQEMMYGYDVWFNCNSCPFAECYEPDTREQFLAGVTEREADYMRFEEAEKRRQMDEEEYRQSSYHQEQVVFADSIRKKVENKVLLSPEEFERALAFRETRTSRYIDFYSVEDLVGYQLSALGYKGAAEELVNYMENMWGY